LCLAPSLPQRAEWEYELKVDGNRALASFVVGAFINAVTFTGELMARKTKAFFGLQRILLFAVRILPNPAIVSQRPKTMLRSTSREVK
jgi:hypothetical protein